MKQNKSVLIIGAGLGGLFLGAILAKEGLKVTILEKNATIGGGLQSFKRFGEWFDTGMHVIGGMRPGGNIMRICQYLGINDRLSIADVDDNCADELYFAEDKAVYRIPVGREAFVAALTSYFPNEGEGIRNYVDAIFNITDGVDMFNLRPTAGFGSPLSKENLIATDDFIAQFVTDRKLRAVLAYMNPLYGGRENQTPAYIHAIIQVLYINGACRFVGGSYRFAEVLASVIIDNGGKVLTNHGVKSIVVENREVVSVMDAQGCSYDADYYVSAIHPCALLQLLSQSAFPRSYCTRLEEIPNSYSAFSLYLKFKPVTFPYLNRSVYYMSEYDKIWKFGESHPQWPLGFMFMTPPEDNQGKWATKALITAPMLFSEVAPWAETTVGRRGPAYEAWKIEQCELLLAKLEELYPNIRACIESICAASPLTIRDFYGSKDGCLSGYSKDWHNMALSQVPVVTKVKNLLLTGQNNNLHGFCGVPLTAINTAEVILGLNYVINKINEIAS